jgi:hypothetical protein
MKLETHTPLQRIGAKRSRALVSIRAAGLIAALVVVLATVASLADRPRRSSSPAPDVAPLSGSVMERAP